MPERLRVLQLASPSGLYGAEHWVLALIRNLDPMRVESVVATVKDTPQDAGPVCEEARKLGFPAFVLDAPGRFNASALTQLTRLVREESIDIVHTHGYKMDFLGLLAARLAGRPAVTTIHGWTSKPDAVLRLYELMDRLLFQFFSAIVALSSDLYRSVEHIPFVRKKLTLITNGVDLTEVYNAGDVPTELADLKRRGKVVVGSIGRLVPGKGIDTIIHALARYGSPDWHLVLVGTGPSEADLKHLAVTLGVAERVVFLGFRPDRLALLKGFDVFVLASHSEGTPRSVMEAMAARVPVVATDIEGCRNLIRHGETGVTFRPSDPHGLAEGVRVFLSDGSLRLRTVSAAASVVSTHFSAARMAREYEELFMRLVDSPSASRPGTRP